MKTLTLEIPEVMELDDNEIKMALASKLYERGKLTLGQAAQLVGYSKDVFMQMLAEYDVNYMDFPASELINDISNAEKYSI